jgi:putative Ca2+/H+ antiporter (TMEM165/GDT1 family)
MNVVAPLVLSTFGVVFVAELPDKTALASLILC